jgi:uncharacterized phage-associated protein
MASVDDVAAAILARTGPLSAMKLQKLVYYAQAWHLVWEDRPLFDARIEAWANGPVSPKLYRRHRGQFRVSSWPHGDPGKLDEGELTTIESVVNFYGDKSAQWLSELTHREDPWRLARAGLRAGERGNAEINRASMAEYYAGL